MTFGDLSASTVDPPKQKHENHDCKTRMFWNLTETAGINYQPYQLLSGFVQPSAALSFCWLGFQAIRAM